MVKVIRVYSIYFHGDPSNYICCSVSKSCPTLCYPMDCSMPVLPVSLPFTVSWSLLRLMSIESVITSSVASCSSCPHQSFPVSQPFASGVQSISASALASVLPMNIQGWFPLVLTGLLSDKYCQSRARD